MAYLSSKRQFLKTGFFGLIGIGTAGRTFARNSAKPHVLVAGAGAFGGWAALYLLRQGARVTLVDPWGPGNPRSSSGGQTRNLTGAYGTPEVYLEWARRSMRLWQEHQQQWQLPLYDPIGALWMVREDLTIGDTATDRTADYTRWMDEDVEGGEKLTPDEAHARFPQINMDGIRTTLYEKEAGILFARRACYAVIDGFLAEGGVYRQSGVVSTLIKDGEMQEVSLSDGSRIKADRYVFACGPWLGKLFPDAVGRHLTVTRQEIYYLEVPNGDKRFYNSQLPHWVDWGQEIWWGVPAHQKWGFAVADHGLGPRFDPTSGDRQVSQAGKEAALTQVGSRFPGMKEAAYLTGRVCQYTNTPDGDYIIGRHPEAENAWIYGGGSGTGFHAGPARGQDMAKYVLDHGMPDPRFSLSRFQGPV
ncbi:MAG: FAD-dependent oxidoreductase [Gammaproteobacteria bacterium]|nr:FAD-dependent oxidoreductase [Gammaproteobacteria bacterium]